MARIEFRSIEKRFGEVEVIPDMNLMIDDGEFVALLGPSGCGKSTSLFMLAGIYMPSSGELLFDGHVVNEVEAKDRNVGIVFQSYALYPHMSVRDNILFPLRFKKTPRYEALRRVREAADLVHVGELLDRKPSELSGGQQQRVALARALVKEPQLLLLDEPLSNLDATLRLSMRTEIKSLQDKLGVTTVLVTHDQIEATTMADRIICMRGGRIEQIGTPDDLYLRPESVFIASFIGSPPINWMDGAVQDGAVRLSGLVLPLTAAAATGAVKVGLRPEHLAFTAAGLNGQIAQIEPMGREILYVVDTEVGHLRVLEHGSSAAHTAGEGVRIGFAVEDLLVFDAASEKLLPGVRVPPTGMRDEEGGPLPAASPPTAVEGPDGPIRLKWHKLRTRLDEAPFKLSNLALGWRLGASLEVDVLAAAERRLMVLHDATLGPSTTGRGHVSKVSAVALAGLFHRDEHGAADRDAPVLSLAGLMAHLKQLPRGVGATLQLDLKIVKGQPLTDASIAEAAQAAEGMEETIVVGSHHLDEARRLADAMRGARVGYDPMLAVSQNPVLARSPERLLQHMERRSDGVTLAFLRFDAVLAAEAVGFPLVKHLLDIGLETDAWTVNPGLAMTDAILRTLTWSGIRQMTTDAPQEMARMIRAASGSKQ